MSNISHILAAVVVLASMGSMAASADAQTSARSDGRFLTAALPPAAALQAPQGGAPARDSVLNGILIGAAVGGLLGLVPDYLDDCEECHDALYASIAVGAGVGLLVDVLKSRGPVGLELKAGRRSVAVGTRIRWP